jgi:hypothetical protein
MGEDVGSPIGRQLKSMNHIDDAIFTFQVQGANQIRRKKAHKKKSSENLLHLRHSAGDTDLYELRKIFTSCQQQYL